MHPPVTNLQRRARDAHQLTFAPWAKAFYESQRARGARHQAALRALAFKWIRVLHRCWLDHVPYDEARYLLALQKRQSPLLAFAARR
jgi:hypothetical protein